MPRNKNTVPDGENNGRIKFIYFEAENVGGDLANAIAALATAVRTPPTQSFPIAPPTRQIESRHADMITMEQPVLPLDEQDSPNESGINNTLPPAPRREKKPFKGIVDDTINWDNGGMPYEDFIKQKNPQDTMKKYLAIAAWYKQYGGRETVNSNLIYNAYRKLGWGTQVDISQPLRDGARSNRGYFRALGKGTYEITGFGLDVVEKMAKDGASEA